MNRFKRILTILMINMTLTELKRSKINRNRKLPLGIFYINNKKSFEENIGLYADNKEPICFRERETNKIQEFIELNMR